MFSYNYKTGNIMQFERRIVRWEKRGSELRFYTQDRGFKGYFSRHELKEFAKFVQWLTEQRGCSFGADIDAFCRAELRDA